VLESEPLRDGKRPPRSAKQHLHGPVEFRPAGVKYQEAVQPALVECPVPYRAGIDVDKTRMRIPADTPALHRPGFGHRIGKLRFEADVERAAHDMLAVLGNAKGRPGEHRIRLGRAIGRKDRPFGLAHCIEHIGQEVDHPDIDLYLFPGMMVAEEKAEFVDDPFESVTWIDPEHTLSSAGWEQIGIRLGQSWAPVPARRRHTGGWEASGCADAGV
jgi:hypothetical protein